MKKMFVLITLMFVLLMTGCSAVQEVTNGLEYVPAATEYIQEVQKFSSDLPVLAEQAVLDKNARVQLEESMIEMKSDIQDFNGLTPPTVFEDVHNQIVDHNAVFEKGLDTYLSAIKNGELNSELLAKTGLMDEIAVYKDLLEQIKQIGQ